MFYKLVVFFVLLAFAMAHDRTHYEEKFFDWMKEHEVVFSDGEEFLRRLEIFIDWDKKIEEHNASGASWQMAHNKFSIYTQKEFGEKFLSTTLVDERPETNEVFEAEPNLKAPSSWDWQGYGYVTGVKDQGSCGSCWSFGATGALESKYAQKSGYLYTFSEQQLIDCVYDNGIGCDGGFYTTAWDWIKSNGGICTGSEYPYKSKYGRDGYACESCSEVSGTAPRGYSYVSPSESNMINAVYGQPVAVAINANSGFQMYSSGVFTGDCPSSANHAVLTVGYGTDGGLEYWRIKNSWGTRWGEDGYIRIQKGKNQSGGQCGILNYGYYPYF